MARKDDPYLPLYVKDFLTDEKLVYCSAEATGVYIRLMCLMHKSEEYGTILLKQNFKQTSKQAKNFALQLAKQLPYEVDVIERGLDELLENQVIHFRDNLMFQKRMVKDGASSENRAKAGSLGGKKTQEKNKDFAKANDKANAKAKSEANTGIVNEIGTGSGIIEKDKGGMGEKEKTNLPARMNAELTIQMSVSDNNRAHDVIDMQNNLPRGSGKKMAEIFLSMLDATGELQKHNPDDMGRYFINWANYHAKRLRPMLENAGNKSEVVSTYFEKTTGKQTPDEMLKSLHAYLK